MVRLLSRIISWFISNRKIALALSGILLVTGVLSYYYLPKQENPDTSSPATQIVAIYPGASSSEVENLLTRPLEDAVATIDGIDFIKSYSKDNLSIVIVMLNYEVDYDQEWEKLSDEIDAIRNTLPTGVTDILISSDLTDSTDFIFSISSNEFDLDQLSNYAETLRERINRIDTIRTCEVIGAPDKNLVVEVDQDKLDLYPISLQDLSQLISAKTVSIPPGDIGDETLGKINVSIEGTSGIRDLENMIVYISEDSGHQIRLKDLAQVYFEIPEDAQTYQTNRESAILVTGYFKDNQNIVLAGREIEAVWEEFSSQLPASITPTSVIYLPHDVDSAVTDFIINLLQGIALVILVVLVGMGRRNALVVSITLPLSISMSLLFMYLVRFEMHQVSIAALIISLGILVDNAIVVADAIQVHMNTGMPSDQAALLGAREQAMPIFSSTLTTIAAFAPLTTLPGEAGEFVKTLPLVVIAALISSYLVAILVVPSIAARYFIPATTKKDHLAFIKIRYRRLLDRSLDHPKRTLLIALTALLLSVLSLFMLDVKMFPNVDKDLVYLNISNESPANRLQTEETLDLTLELLSNIEEIDSVTATAGGGLPRFYMTEAVMGQGQENAQILASFDLAKSNRFSSRDELVAYIDTLLRSNVAGIRMKTRLLEINMPGSPLEVRVLGDDLDQIRQASDQIYQYLVQMPGTRNVQLDREDYRYEYSLQIDDDQAMTYGLTVYDIQNQVNSALSGRQVGIFRSTGQEYDLYLRSDVANLEELENLGLKSPYTSQKTLLKQVADISLSRAISSSERYNRSNMAMVSAEVQEGYGVGKIQQNLEDYIAEDMQLDGLEFSFGGDSKTTSKYLSGLVNAGLVALVVVYIILLLQFNSVRQPFIILGTIPLSFIGVILFLHLTRTNFTFTVGLGIASLFGIVVNNGILLIEYINRERKGKDLREALEEAVEKRMSPIILSSVTTICGLLPLIFANNSFFTPMAIALAGGLLVSTVFTMTIIPTMYYVFHANSK
jgi:multidrug efflux pump subunit AcrB